MGRTRRRPRHVFVCDGNRDRRISRALYLRRHRHALALARHLPGARRPQLDRRAHGPRLASSGKEFCARRTPAAGSGPCQGTSAQSAAAGQFRHGRDRALRASRMLYLCELLPRRRAFPSELGTTGQHLLCLSARSRHHTAVRPVPRSLRLSPHHASSTAP